MESRLDDSWSNDFYEFEDFDSSPWDADSESYDVDGEWNDGERSSARRPKRRPPIQRARPPRPTGMARPASTGIINTPAGPAEIRVPALNALTQRTAEQARGIAQNSTGLAQLDERQKSENAELFAMVKKTQSVTDARFKRQAIATAIAAVTPLVFQFVAARLGNNP